MRAFCGVLISSRPLLPCRLGRRWRDSLLSTFPVQREQEAIAVLLVEYYSLQYFDMVLSLAIPD